MVVKVSRRGEIFAACDGFPDCKTTFSVPKGINKFKMLDENCKTCEEKKRGNVKMFDIELYDSFYEDDRVKNFLNGKKGGTYCFMKD